MYGARKKPNYFLRVIISLSVAVIISFALIFFGSRLGEKVPDEITPETTAPESTLARPEFDFKTVEESVIAQQTTLTDADNGEEFCLPRQSSSANTFRAHNSSKRTPSAHRTNTVFIASGKVINSALRFFIQNISIITRSSLTDPSCKLIRMGKLII